jgi:hypothetical protein
VRPEDYVRQYIEGRDAVSAPSIDLVRATGLVYAKRCGAERKGPPLSRKARLAGATMPKPKICTHRHRHWSHAERQWVCGRCGSPWRHWERRALRGEVQETGTRQDGSEARMERRVNVGLALRRLLESPKAETRWVGRVYVEHALGLSFREIAAAGAAGEYGAGAPFNWNLTAVRNASAAGGREWRAILKAAHLPFD